MIKVAMVGAGSVVFSKNLTGDILSFPEFKNATLSYMDIDAERLEVGANLCRKVAHALDATPTIQATQDRREALRDADFVINMVQIGGFNSTLVDFEIPRKYGLNFTIADTTGPGGFFRALRTFPMLSGLVRDMEEVAPKATLLNYSNPMGMNMQTVTRTSGVKAVGLCHSVQGTFNELMRYVGEEPDEVAFICAGINHMAFYTKIEKNGVDLYPRLFEAMNDPEKYKTNKVRFELMKRLGYFITESSEHNAEYSAHFIPHGEETIEKFDVPIDEYLRRCDGIVDEFERMKTFSVSDEPMNVHRSHEYGSTIIHSISTGTPSVVYGNMPNNGAISNLPNSAIVELPTLVDRNGLQFTTVGELPPQLVGYMNPHITQQELFIRAAMEGRRDHIYQAAMFDPLTAATLTTDKIVEMCDELIEAHGDLLPPLPKQTLVPTSGLNFSPPTPQELRDSWDNAQRAVKKSIAEIIVPKWQILGPIPSNDPRKLEAEDLLQGDGSVLLTQIHHIASQELKWKEANADESGQIDLTKVCGAFEYCDAWAYAEYVSIHARETEILAGSDDGIEIWINGQSVHSNLNVMRSYRWSEDRAPIRLNEGVNRILVKIHNDTAGWGFGIGIPKANF